MPAPIPSFDFDPRDPAVLAGFHKELGYAVTEWTPEQVRVELPISAKHRNLGGVVHGGVQSSLLDIAGAYCAMLPTDGGKPRRVVTLSLTVNFLGATGEGRLICTVRRRGPGKKIVAISGEITSSDGALIAVGEALYRQVQHTDQEASTK